MSIRVLHCIHSLSGGGAERQVQLLAAASHDEGMIPGIFCVNETGGEQLGRTVRIYKSLKSMKYNLSLFSSIHDVVIDFRPDVVHAWLPASMTIPAMLVAWVHRIPSVFSYRNKMFFNRPLTVPEYLCAAGAVSRVVSNNPIGQSNRAYRFLYRWKQGVEIANAVHVDAGFRKAITDPTAGSTKTILLAGRLTKQKNWQCLLRALPLIDRQHSYRVTICGDGEDAGAVRKLIHALNLQDRVTLLGYRRDLYAIMQGTDVLVLPSWYEGMPNVLLEALAVGIPCLVSDIPAHRDLIGDTRCAVMFDPGAPAELAARLNGFFAAPGSVAGMVRAGWAVADAHSPATMAQQYTRFYRALLSGTSGHASEIGPALNRQGSGHTR